MTRAGSSARSPIRNGRSSLTPAVDERLAGHGAADADQALVGDDLDDGVDVVLGLEFLGPAALDGAAGQAGQAEVGDLHGLTPESVHGRTG